MINIITNTSIEATEKQKALVEEALGPDGVYVRMKENLLDMLDRGDIKGADRAKVVSDVISQMSISITNAAMSTGLEWAYREKELSLKKEELSRSLELLEHQVTKASHEAIAADSQKQMSQAQLIRDYGMPILDNEGNVVSLLDEGRVYETIENLKQDTANKAELNDQIKAQTDEVYARTHRLVADTYVNHGVYSWTTLQKNGMAGVTKATTGYTTLSDLQKVVTGEQAKGYAYNAWGNAASASGGMIGTLVAAEIPGLDPGVYLQAWLNSVTKINAVTAPSVSM